MELKHLQSILKLNSNYIATIEKQIESNRQLHRWGYIKLSKGTIALKAQLKLKATVKRFVATQKAVKAEIKKGCTRKHKEMSIQDEVEMLGCPRLLYCTNVRD